LLSKKERSMRQPCQVKPRVRRLNACSAASLFGSGWPDFGDEIEVAFEDQFGASGSPSVLEVANDGR
jgi:hypothetical protein